MALAFDHDPLTADWTFGAGYPNTLCRNQPLDFLLTVPERPGIDNIGMIAFSIKVQRDTGFLMLSAVESDVYYMVNGTERHLKQHVDSYVLFQEINVLRLANGLEYTVRYVIPEDKEALRNARRDFLQRRPPRSLSPLLSLWKCPPKLSDYIVHMGEKFEYLIFSPRPSILLGKALFSQRSISEVAFPDSLSESRL